MEESEFEPGPLTLECVCLTLVYCFSVMAHHSKMKILIHIKQTNFCSDVVDDRINSGSKGFLFSFALCVCVCVMDKLQNRG